MTWNSHYNTHIMQQKEMDYDEPHPVPNEKTQPIQRTKRPTGALVAAGSLWSCIKHASDWSYAAIVADDLHSFILIKI
jgi:hypothetical protein